MASVPEEFHELKGEPRIQQFGSMLLRQFFTTADIVKKGDKWYAREPQLSNIKIRTSDDEVGADAALIGFLIGDFERRVGKNFVYKENKVIYLDFSGLTEFFRDDELHFHKLEALLEKKTTLLPYVNALAEKMLKYWGKPEGHDQIEAALEAAGPISKIFHTNSKGKTFEDFYALLLTRVKAVHRLCSKLEKEAGEI